MEQQQALGRPAARHTSREQQRAARRRARRLRLARNWALFLSACAAVAFAVTSGVLWLLPRACALVAPQEEFAPRAYEAAGYVFNEADPRLTLVNANLPLAAEPAPELAVADDASGVQLEREAAEAYRTMAAAALADGIELRLAAGYQAAEARQAAYDAQKQKYLDRGCTDEEAAARAASVVPPAQASEYATGYAADILAADSAAADTGFAQTRAFAWLQAYAAEYGFILRWPEDRQAATGMVYEPWHWRYVGAENALAVRASGLSLEEFLAVNRLQ